MWASWMNMKAWEIWAMCRIQTWANHIAIFLTTTSGSIFNWIEYRQIMDTVDNLLQIKQEVTEMLTIGE